MGAARVSVGPELPSAAGGTEAGVPPPHPVGDDRLRQSRQNLPICLTNFVDICNVCLFCPALFLYAFKKKKNLLIWLGWVFTAAHGRFHFSMPTLM